MPAEVKLPGVGPVSKRALLIGGGLSIAVLGVVWWRRRTAAAAPAPADAGVDTSGDLTGADTSAAGGGGGGGSSTSSSTGITSNPQWSAEVLQLLGGVVDPSALSQAIGLYLTGGAVTHDQELIIDQAIAAAGYPPVAGPSGYPPAIRQSPAGGQTTPTPPPLVDDGTVLAGRNVQGYFEAWNRHNPGLNLTWRHFVEMNPQAPANLKTFGNTDGRDDVWIHNAKYRLR